MSDTPRRLGNRYEVGDLLGRGGMAEVHKGHDLRLSRPVAVKLLRPDLARDPSFQARFRREAQSAASLNHPAVVAVYDTGEDHAPGDGTALPYIVMEYVDGTTLRELLDDGRRLLPERALEITAGVLAALDYSHRHGIVHRDIKPANVMLTRHGDVKVMDFGIARAVADTSATMTQTSAVIGTAQYLSPEQARGEQVDSRSDIYSTGCLLYELLTGRPPFVGDSPVSVAYQHVREEPLPPSAFDPEIPPAIDAIVLKSLTKDREQRYQTAAEMRADIQRALDGQPVAAPAPRPADGATQAMPAVAAMPAATTTLPRMVDAAPEEPQRRNRAWMYALLAVAVVAVFLLAAIVGSKLVSGSAEKVSVPKVVGKTVAQARSILESKGLSVGTTTPRVTDTVPPDTVLEQKPGENARVDPTTTKVDLVVAAGPKTAAVPTLVGLSLDQAQAALKQANLQVGDVKRKPSAEKQDQVLDASAQPGQQLNVGSPVDLTVASGENVVPNVKGFDADQAQQTLTEAGFDVRVVNQYDDANQPNKVLDQTPSADETRPLGSSVTITVSQARPTPTPTPSSSSPSTSPTSTPPTTSTSPSTAGPSTPPPSNG